MAELFVDTSGWASVLEKSEPFHVLADAILEETLANRERFVTTNLVLIELTALLTKPMRVSKARQLEMIGDLRRDPAISIVSINAALEEDAWRLWNDRPD